MLTAADAAEGLRLARQFKPTLITLDVVMPRMDGWAVLRSSRRIRPRGHPGGHAEHPRRAGEGVRTRRGRLPDEALRSRPSAQRASGPSYGGPGARVLVVEDDDAIRAILRDMLERKAARSMSLRTASSRLSAWPRRNQTSSCSIS